MNSFLRHQSIRQILCFLFGLSFISLASANCDTLAQENHQYQLAAEQFTKTTQVIQDALAGKEPLNVPIILALLKPLETSASPLQMLETLQQQQTLNQQMLAESPSSEFLSSQDCGELTALWVQSRKEHFKTRSVLIRNKQALFSIPIKRLHLLSRQLYVWQQVTTIQHTISEAVTALDEVALQRLGYEPLSLELWMTDYLALSQSWFALLPSDLTDAERLDTVWRQALALPRVNNATDWSSYQLAFPTAANTWLTQLSDARRQLVLGISQWRNTTIWTLGWPHFARAITTPQFLFDALTTELLAAPSLLVDNLKAPFIREYMVYERQNESGKILTGWLFQTFALLMLGYAIIKLSHASPRLLATWQRVMLAKITQPSFARMASGLFWLIKPNTPWLTVLISSLAVAAFCQQWVILSFIGPLGVIYAVFRGVRVTFEWLISRTYARAGEFVSPNTSMSIERDAQRFSSAIVVCWLAVQLGEGIGGGYLRFIVVITVMVCIWWALFWLTHVHSKAVSSFMPYGKNAKEGKNGAQKPSALRAATIKLSTPLLFLTAHFFDAIRSMNEKLLSFDSYRSFTAKLMRAHLESKAEVDDHDDTEPDENYSDWMTRPASEKLTFEVGETEAFFEPIQRWHQEKTDENLLLLVGESGSGKTTFVNQLTQRWTETEVHYIRFDDKTRSREAVFGAMTQALKQTKINDITELVKLDAALSPQVIVIDDAHNLFLAEVGEFDGFRALMHCMNAQLENIFWVVVMHAPSWSYLSCVFSREQRISNIYRMPRWSPQDIRRLILSRHQGGKRRLRYNELLLSATANSESSSVRGADSRVFNILWEQSGGNPTAAIELWLNAAKIKGRTVEIGVPQRPSSTPLSGMKDDLYFIYAALVVHHSLSTKEIMRVTHFAEPIVRHALKQGINLGLILRDERGRYAIDSYWYGTLSSFLQRKNLLWH